MREEQEANPPASSSMRPAALPAAERRRRIREFWIGVVLVAAMGGLLLVPPITGLTKGVGDSTLFLFLNAITVILILIFGFLVTRNFWKLVGERRRGILGSHLNLKFVAAFVLIALVTTSGLFAVSAFFITNSIDTWFSVQVDRALEESGEVAESHYETVASNALFYGGRIAERIGAQRLIERNDRAALEALVQEMQRDYNLGVVEVFSASGEELVTAINPEIPAANFSRPDSEIVREAIAGREPGWHVDEIGSGDAIRGAVPIESAKRPGEVVGAVVVNVLIPFAQARKVASIRSTLDEYRRLQPMAGSVRTSYLLELLLAFTMVLMLALWMGFRLARGVTGPLRALAEGTGDVARGNLDVQVEVDTDDEVGLLVDSFNQMIRDLRDARNDNDRKATELDRRRRYMEIVLGNVGAGVVSVGPDARISAINASAQRYLGIPAGTGLLGQRLEDVANQTSLLEVIGEMKAALLPGVRESVRRQVQIPLGDDVATLFVTLTVMHDEVGDSLGSVVVFDDYTQLVKVQRMAAWREVARRIAHEIKNPLTPIQLSAQRLRRRFAGRFGADTASARILDECVEAITTQVDTLKLLVDEFSNFARLPASNPKPDDLNRIVSDAVASYAGTEGVALETELDSALPAVELDREQMRRALTNLIDNAIAAIRQGGFGSGRVRLVTQFDPALQSARLVVSDDGVGIPAQDRRRVFEPYFSRSENGTGLGLAIVSRIVADHHGYVRVQDNPPRGTRFVIELPVARADAPRLVAPARAEAGR
ncbi:MAG TPA: ATP-binding protein [Myxococcota bacterium]|nr:ATP-binding protein [Myxococcota bacterium]